jgi:prepilin-type N-terminal cleavage/methylation domain-containing protein
MNKAFTLIELMIVTGVIGVISAIAIPNIFEMRRCGRESGAMSTLRSQITPAMYEYRAKGFQDELDSSWGVFPAHLSALAGGDAASVYSTNDKAKCTAPGGVNLLPKKFNNHDGAGGSNIGHYRFGHGRSEGFFENRGCVVDGYVYSVVTSTLKDDGPEEPGLGKRLRQMYVTVIASPVGAKPGDGNRAFGMTLSPCYYDHICAMTGPENRADQLMKDAQYYPENGMFKNPAGGEKAGDMGWGHGPKCAQIAR